MCGIAGIVHLNNEPIELSSLGEMTKEISHRGPDDYGYALFTNDDYITGREEILQQTGRYFLGLGHRRLSILDLSPAGHQPMTTEDKNLWIVFNGEIYNFIELRNELVNKGYTFYSSTDTEVILRAYQEWGEGCFNRFNGMWAIAIYDRSKQKLICSRDRLGVKPFYYYYKNGQFAFSSEIKQLLKISNIKRKVNPEIFHDFMVIGYLSHTENTFFEDIKALPGGSYISIDLYTANPNMVIKKYWDLEINTSYSNLDLDEVIENFSELFIDSVNLRLRSDVPIGTCLSGGLDSSAVVCTMNKLLREKSDNFIQKTFTSCFEDKRLDEREFAQSVIDQTKVNGIMIFPDYQELLDSLDKVIWHQDEPFTSTSIFAQWCVMKSAKENGVKVILDGQGGDEILFGYERYYADLLNYLLRRFKIFSAIDEFRHAGKYSKLSHLDILRYYIYFNYPSIRANRLNSRSKNLLHQDISNNINVKDRLPDNTEIHKMQKSEIMSYQMPQLLRYADRNSMAHSIEARIPFLDYRIVEFGYSINPVFKIRDGWTKYVLREAMKGIMPEKVCKRVNKLGFETPQETWMAKMTPSLIKHINESENQISGYLNMDNLRKNMNTGAINNQTLWKIYSFTRWMKVFDVQ